MEQSEAELLEQWEPKVHSMLRNVSILGLGREDIAQELRIAILKSARGYNPENTSAKFHTYLHVSMLNVIRSLIAKAQKRVNTLSIDKFYHTGKNSTVVEGYMVASKLLAALEDPQQAQAFEEINLLSLIENSNLTSKELEFIDLRTQRYRLREITEILGVNAARLRENVKKKLEWGLTHAD